MQLLGKKFWGAKNFVQKSSFFDLFVTLAKKADWRGRKKPLKKVRRSLSKKNHKLYKISTHY
jgi:hypothetical protein